MRNLILAITTSVLLSGCGYTLISRHDLEWTKEAYRGIGYMEACNKMLDLMVSRRHTQRMNEYDDLGGMDEIAEESVRKTDMKLRRQ